MTTKRPNPILIALAAFGASTGMLYSTAAEAQVGHFKAKPVTAAQENRLVVRDSLWRCDANGCFSTTKGASRAAHMCESLVKEIGAVSSFRAGTTEFAAEQLAKCNARAKSATIASK